MILHQVDGLQYYAFECFEDTGVISAVFTRHGGVSLPPWASLNVGGTVGDKADHVAENRRRSFAAVRRNLASMFDVWQVHSTTVVRADNPRPLHLPHQKADAIITDKEDVTLFMRFADCVPILLYDPVHRAIGLVHAGWVGTVGQIGKAAVQAMQANFGTDPVSLLAGIGPSICIDHYPVGEDVAVRVRRSFGGDAREVLRTQEGVVYLDLWGANRMVLERTGIKQIELSGICTAGNMQDWFSHRGEMGKTGRFGALFAIKS